jgi:transposase InsO family protein
MEYTSFAYGVLLQKHAIIASMSATGNCYDNAIKESFFATLKTECVVQPYCSFATRAQARTAILSILRVFTIGSVCILRSAISALSNLSSYTISRLCDFGATPKLAILHLVDKMCPLFIYIISPPYRRLFYVVD